MTKQFLHDDNSGKFVGDEGKKKRLETCRRIEQELAKTVNLLDQYSLRNTLPTLKAIYPYLQKLRSDPYKVLAMGLQTAAKAAIQKWSNRQKASLPRFKSGKKTMHASVLMNR